MKIPKLLIELKPSRIDKAGVGVFAVVSIKKGEKVADGIPMEDFSELISWKKFLCFSKEIKEKIMNFCVGTAEGFVPPKEMDFNKLSVEWYFNHSCDGNLGFDRKGDFIAIKNIKNGEELTYDYGLVESNAKFMMICNCKSKQCRTFITGNDWKILIKDKNKSKYMHPFLLEKYSSCR
jgi:SET domain-containing protein